MMGNTTFDVYIESHKAMYQRMAEAITPVYDNWEQIWDRAAFAILSAHTHFKTAVKTLQYVTTCKGYADPCMVTSHVPATTRYVNSLPLGHACQRLLQRNGEPWHGYRERIRTTVLGVARTKASFLVSLLYPTVSDVACIDTHMLKVYDDEVSSFQALTLSAYCRIEAKVRRMGQRHGIHTFLAQWLMWDCVRGIVEPHDIFPREAL